jgi:hypothetical protein
MGQRAIARRLNLTRHSVRTILSSSSRPFVSPLNQRWDEGDKGAEASGVVEAPDRRHALESLLASIGVDQTVWRVKRWVANRWGDPGRFNWQTKAWLERIAPEESRLDELISRLEAAAPIDPAPPAPEVRRSGRALEVSIMDPHFGLRAFAGPAGADYSFEKAESLWWASIWGILERAKQHGPFDRICFVLGNDLMHADNVFHTTTQGTGQPEMDSWTATFIRVEELVLRTINLLLEHAAAVDVLVIPGNHDRQSAFALGRVVSAYYRHCNRVAVTSTGSPYSFWRFGVNLVGFDHGHSIKPSDLPGLMANECRDVWHDVWHCQWHCGDQHREAPQFGGHGITIKYLPSFVAWNEWHKIKGYSWSHRAALGFIYDERGGAIAQVQVNAREVYGTQSAE